MSKARPKDMTSNAKYTPGAVNLFGEVQATCPRCNRTITPSTPCAHVTGATADLFSGAPTYTLDRASRRRPRPALPGYTPEPDLIAEAIAAFSARVGDPDAAGLIYPPTRRRPPTTCADVPAIVEALARRRAARRWQS